VIPVIEVLLFILGFALLVKGGDWLVDGASALAHSYNVSDLVVGLTVVSFGTSAPELIVNLFASFSEAESIALGNILGSNIANVFLVLGVAATFHPLSLQGRTVWKELPFALILTIVLGILCNDIFFANTPGNLLSNGDGLVLLIFFGLFIYYTYETGAEEQFVREAPRFNRGKAVLFVLLGSAALAGGGHLVVENAQNMARDFGISEAFIGLTAVALGTSLPEVVTSLVAAFKSQSDIAVGNVVGSNIFNIALVLGISASVRGIPYNISFNSDLLIALAAVVILFTFMFLGKRNSLGRAEGVLFFLIYTMYIALTYFTRI